jgi:hypothetical protein
MTKRAGHPPHLLGELAEIEAVCCGAEAMGEGGVTLHTKIAERPFGLALTEAVHRQKHRVIGGVGVHARRPLLIMLGVTALAGLRVEQLLLCEWCDGRLMHPRL